jgi:Tol biopolymer transport system component
VGPAEAEPVVAGHDTARLTAALDGRYRIERELGTGGMATVYLAHDVKHERKVAVKVLKPELAAVLGAERFVVEIKTTASLQHPHILPLFDSGEADGFLYYVMPFIDGETLRAKLDRESQLGVDEAVRITTEIAGALHHAHEHGVIHRDIKPENILLQDGRPMVADFGIALAVSAAAGGRMTETGLSLGTPHYMSPEQATAEKEITARSDQYSLASVLYEMLTGDPPHTGATAQQIIMKIITEPAADVTAMRKSVPPAVADAVARALEKLPADRFPSVQAFAAALGGEGATSRVAGGTRSRATDTATAGRWRTIAFASLAVAVASSAFAVSRVASSVDAAEAERVAFAYRPIASQADWPYVDISADGRHILQVVRDSDGVDHVALRSLGATEMSIVPGTAGARDPQFTPDGSAILFNARTRGYRVPLQGGTPTIVSDSASSAGFAFLPDGHLVAVRNQVGLQVFTGDGRFVQQLTEVDTVRGEFSHWYPQALPGGRAVMFNSYATPFEESRIEAVDVESGERTVLVEGAIFARYVETGHLLFARNNAIYAVPFDAESLRVLGREVPVVEDVAMNVTNGTAGYAVSRTGTLAYMRASQWRVESRVLWADRSGATTPAIAEEGGWAEPRLSPDGRWIAVTRTDPQPQVWLHDNARRVLSQLTRSEGVSFSPVWTPDSRALLLAREVPQYDVYRQPIDGSAASLAVGSRDDKLPLALSPDGRQLAFTNVRDRDRLAIADLGSGEQRVVDEQQVAQRTADISPDGRWLAYGESNPAGTYDVFVRALDGRGGRRQVSSDGGDQPRFTKGGREIVYRKGDAFIAVPFDPASGDAGTPVPLFRAADAGRLSYGRTVGYDVTPDGSRFLFVAPIERPEATPNVVVLHWFADLRRMVPR